MGLVLLGHWRVVFEQSPDYEAVYIGKFPASGEEYLPTALRCARDRLDQLGLNLGG